MNCPFCGGSELYECDDGGNEYCTSCKRLFHQCKNGDVTINNIKYCVNGEGPSFCDGCNNDNDSEW